jgi:hypothetical protein
MRILLALLFTLSLTPSLPAHPGGRNKEGCHTCKAHCAKWGLEDGEYHCHNKKIKKAKPETHSKKSPSKKNKPKRS